MIGGLTEESLDLVIPPFADFEMLSDAKDVGYIEKRCSRGKGYKAVHRLLQQFNK